MFHLLSILRREIQNKAVEERKKGTQRPHGMVMAPLSLLIRNKPNHRDWKKCLWWQATLSFGKCQLWGRNKRPGSKTVHDFSGIRRYTNISALLSINRCFIWPWSQASINEPLSTSHADLVVQGTRYLIIRLWTSKPKIQTQKIISASHGQAWAHL